MSDDPLFVPWVELPPKDDQLWPKKLTAENLRGIKYDPVIFCQEYPGEPFDPFADDCLCGHSKHGHRTMNPKVFRRCRGTAQEHCTCMKYIKKEAG